MRVLVVHNAYRQRGGEDSVVEAEIELLERNGHTVETYGRHNNELSQMRKLDAATQTFWSRRTIGDLDFIAAYFRPDVLHVHNTFPLISPSLYWAADKLGLPLVQTLHNFRLLCPQGMFLREEKLCEDCLGKLPWRGVQRACYRDSITQSGVLGGTIAMHRGLGTYRRKIATFIALSEFSRNKFIAGGLPAERIVVKPNFVDFPYLPTHERKGFLFVGRLSPEKGVGVLAEAMKHVPGAQTSIAGEGPDAGLIDRVPGIRMLGRQTPGGVHEEMVRAEALLLPSICYENFPRTLVEAFASGLPVIASRMGAMAELIDDGRTGLLFAPGSAQDLAGKMRWALDNPEAMRQMGRAARAEYVRFYTPDRNHAHLMAIYSDAIHRHRGASRKASEAAADMHLAKRSDVAQ